MADREEIVDGEEEEREGNGCLRVGEEGDVIASGKGKLFARKKENVQQEPCRQLEFTLGVSTLRHLFCRIRYTSLHLYHTSPKFSKMTRW